MLVGKKMAFRFQWLSQRQGIKLMKILLVGDLHLRVNCPERRLDEDYKETCLDKLSQIIEIAKENNCYCIIQAGDWHDKFSPDKGLIADEIEIIKELDFQGNIFTIHGQHDLKHHNKKSADSSAIRILEAATSVVDVKKETFPVILGREQIYIHSAPFGQEPLTKPSKAGYDILVSHVMVTPTPLYVNHDYMSPVEYMDKYPGYDLYFVGDIHTPFVTKRKGRLMINAGAVMRSSISDKDRKPKVVLFDTETNEYKDIFLEVQDDIFDTQTLEQEQKEHKFTGLIEKLKEEGQIGVNFEENLLDYIRNNEINKKTLVFIKQHVYNNIEG